MDVGVGKNIKNIEKGKRVGEETNSEPEEELVVKESMVWMWFG